MDPALRELLLSGPDDERIEAILRLRAGAEGLPPQVIPVARFADIMTIRLRRRDVEAVWSHPATLSLKAPRLLQFDAPPPSPDDLFAEPVASRPSGPAPFGNGVVVGVIDWGFDFAHPAFRTPDGASRIMAIWDQRGGPCPLSPRFGYGRVLGQDRINAALETDAPYHALGYHPADADTGHGAHGTHVADIAAGTRRMVDGTRTGGVAPLADLAFVHLASDPLTGLANLGDSVRLLEAIAFLADLAGERPLVINLSIGRHGGPHTGLTLVEQALDRFLEEAPNRMIVQSAGNYFSAQAHAQGQLYSGKTETLDWIVQTGDATPNELEIWYHGRDALQVAITPPTGATPITVPLGHARGIYRWPDQEIARVYHRAFDPNTADHHIEIFLRKGAPWGRWQVTLRGDRIEDGRWHAWIERDNGPPRNRSFFATRHVATTSTLGSICNGFLPVSVGAAQGGGLFGFEPAPFASSGPTRDGRPKPDVCAKGMDIAAARSASRSDRIPSNRMTRMSGASQAAPYVAGTIACLLSARDRPLDAHEIRRRLFAGVQRSIARPHCPRTGIGLVDAAEYNTATL